MPALYSAALTILIVIETTDSALTKTQQKCVINIAQNLQIKQIVVVSESNKFDGNNIRFLKNIQQNNIFTQFSNLHKLNQSIPRRRNKAKIVKIKTLYLLDGYNASKNLAKIFSERYELFLSENVWVIFNKNQNFKNLYIPYNCQFIVIESENGQNFNIREFYNTRMFTRDIYVSNFGKWDEKNNLQISEPDFYQRRFNMNETELVVIKNYLKSSCPHVGICAYEEITKEMARMLNFRPTFMTMDQLRELWKQDVRLLLEVWIAFFVFDTYTYWKYSIAPIWKTPAFIHIKYVKLYEHGTRSPHVRPFATNVWLTITFWLLISAICVTYIDQKINRRNSIIDSIFRSFESFTNQCGCMISPALSSRIAAIMTRAGPALLVPLYSAVIISFVTVKITNLPFTDLQGLVKDGSFKFGYENGTLIGKILRESNTSDARAIRDKLVVSLDEMPTNLEEAIEKICKDRKFAFAFFNNDIFSYEQKCRIIQIPNHIYQTWDAFRLRGGSSYYAILNRILKSFRSSGILKRMEKIVYGEKPRDEETHDLDPVEFENVVELLLVICTLYLIVPVILMIEFLMCKRD